MNGGKTNDKNLRKPLSIILSLMMILSVFTIIPVTSASAAVGDYLSENDYLTFTAEEDDCTVTLNVKSGSNFQYDLNGAGLTGYTPGTKITLANVGDYVRFSGKDTIFNGDKHVSLTGKVACSGNVMSLRLDDNGMVQDLEDSCFYSMFYNCAGLTSAPELPETELVYSCYFRMFSHCDSLTKAPELPATNLAESCYDNMFLGCKSLTELPALPATTLADDCYSCMFEGCTSICISDEAGTFGDITYSAEYRIPTTGEGTSASYALSNMFKDTGGEFTGTPDINTTYYVPAPTYTVTWMNGDEVLETDENVEEGSLPSYNGEAPEKAEDDENTYTFAGWTDGKNTYGLTDTLPNVIADVTYTAVFEGTMKPEVAVAAMINALPTEVTVNNKEAIEAARAAYDALKDEQKALVDADTLAKLTAAEEALAAAEQAAADAVADTINSLPTEVTVNNKEAIEAARAAYDALKDEQKALVDADTLAKLTAA